MPKAAPNRRPGQQSPTPKCFHILLLLKPNRARMWTNYPWQVTNRRPSWTMFLACGSYLSLSLKPACRGPHSSCCRPWWSLRSQDALQDAEHQCCDWVKLKLEPFILTHWRFVKRILSAISGRATREPVFWIKEQDVGIVGVMQTHVKSPRDCV